MISSEERTIQEVARNRLTRNGPNHTKTPLVWFVPFASFRGSYPYFLNQPVFVRPAATFCSLFLASLFLTISIAAQQTTPLDDATAREQATLPPGYTVFSVATAERGLLKNYPYIKRLSTELPPGVRARFGIVYARYGSRELQLDLFQPKRKGIFPAVILVHGGAWITGNHTMENPFAMELAKRGYVAATIEYRLSNEAKYPAQIHDLKASVRWLRANAARYNIDPSRIAAVGASAGGQLVALLGATNGMMRFEGDGGNPETSSIVQSVVDIDGPATFIDPGNIEKEIKGPYDTNTRLIGGTFKEKPELWREASPITHVNGSSAPVLFINSSGNRPFQQREEMSAKLKALGIASEIVVIPDTPHPFWLFHPWFEPTVRYADEFLKRTLSGAGRRPEHVRAPARSVVWRIDNRERIGGNQTTVIGNPQVIKVRGGSAMLFDGLDDGLLLNTNPVAGAPAFTIEAVFRPEAGGSAEQRWFHIQEASGDDRILLETRLTGDQWFLDTFIKSGENSRALYAEKFKHAVGQWYHVALVYDGSTMRHFVDGQEELATPLTIAPLAQGTTSIGVRMNRVYWFKGAVRSARFTPRALSPKEFKGKQ